MIEEKNKHGITLNSRTTQEDERPKVPRQGGDKFRVERAAIVGPGRSDGASASSSSNNVVLDDSNATAIYISRFPVQKTPCYEARRVGTPKLVHLDRVVLPSGEALPSFASNLHFMGGKLQPFMEFAVGAGAE